jgi:hypothetical protein
MHPSCGNVSQWAPALTPCTFELLEHGRLIHTVARRLPLEAVAEAYETVENGELMGNVVLEIP